MLRHYRRSLIDLFGQVNELHENPWGNRELCLRIQETLIKKTFYIEKRIRELDRLTQSNKARLGTEQTPPLTKDEAALLKRTIIKNYQAKEDYKYILNLLQSIGDALAFIYISRWDIKPMSFKESAGFMSGKIGFASELWVLHQVFQEGAVAILSDLTRCLRYGDIIAIGEEVPPTIIEVKTSEQQNNRVQRQKSEIARLAEYIRTDKTSISGYAVNRYESAAICVDYCPELNKYLQEAKKNGFGFGEVEQGLYYYVEMEGKETRFQSLLNSFPHPPIVYFLNMFRLNNIGYYPFTLSIEDPESLFNFYDGRIGIFVLFDPNVVRSKFEVHGFALEFNDQDDECVMTISSKPNDCSNHNQPNKVGVGRHLFNRIPLEFVSLDWIIGETIQKFTDPS